MDEFGPKSRDSLTARAGGWFALAAPVCLVLGAATWEPRLGLVAAACLALGLILGSLGLIDIKRSEGRLRGAGWAKLAFWVPGLILVYGLFFQATSCGPGMRHAQSINNFKQIALALHNYRDSSGRFPPAFVSDSKGRPLYSWRVLILPYLEQANVYARFHLDEPWDSPHNRTLLPEMPATYALPHRRRDEQPDGTTLIQVFLGKGTAFESPRGEALTLPDGSSNFPDGLATTVLAVEARAAVAWTRPIDLPYMADAQLPILGGTDRPRIGPETPHDSFIGILGDASARRLKRTIQERTLRALITRNGHEPIRPEEY